MPSNYTRRSALRLLGACAGAGALAGLPLRSARADRYDAKTQETIRKGLDWVARTQSRIGHWNAGNYPTAMTALAGTALVAGGSTTMQGPYAANIRRAVDYLFTKRRENGLIGEPLRDNRYTYGHGFSMVFLSQILGEEEDEARREELTEVLTKSVEFSAFAQTPSGGWGYVSAKDGNNFDEGSTTITQVQGLRACRNAGIPVDKDIIDRAKKYIYDCKNEDGGISYSSRNRGSSRPAITAAALAALYNAGAYDSEHVPEMWDYTKGKLHNVNANAAETFGHWHYTYLYYSQVVYRRGAEEWAEYSGRLYEKIIREQEDDGSWNGTIGPIYVTACNLIMLQLDLAFLPIYQR